MNNLKKLTLISLATGFVLVGCASKEVDKKVDEKLAAVEPVQNRAQLSEVTARSMESIPNLTETQRAQLVDLRSSTRAKMQANQQESDKIRSLLIQGVFSANYQQKEVNNLKKRLSKLEGERTALTFSAIDQANNILGRAKSEETSRAAHEYINKNFF